MEQQQVLSHVVGRMMQQGANSVSMPATTTAITDPLKKKLLSIEYSDFHAE
jgi:hypothetical protein